MIERHLEVQNMVGNVPSILAKKFYSMPFLAFESSIFLILVVGMFLLSFK